MDAEGAGTGFFAADGDVAFAEYGAGIALAAAAFMLRQGGAVVEAFIHVLAGGLGRTTKGALIEAAAAFQAAAVADADTHAAGAVAAFVADVFKAETAGGEFVVVFVCGRSDGTAFEPDTVGCDVVCPQTWVCNIGRHIEWQWERPSENGFSDGLKYSTST